MSEYHMGLNATERLLTDIDLYFMPIVNPDGYVYSHEEVKEKLVIICKFSGNVHFLQLLFLWCVASFAG